MKIPLIKLFLASMIFAIICMSALAGNISTSVHFQQGSISCSQIQCADGNTYSRFMGSECESYGLVGHPDIPMKRIEFAVPTFSTNFKVEITNAIVGSVSTLTTPVIPNQASQDLNKINPDFFSNPDKEIYRANRVICDAYVASDFFDKGFFHVVSVLVPMISYNPKSGRVEHLSRVDVKLTYDEATAQTLSSTPLTNLSRAMKSDYAATVVNKSNTVSKNSSSLDYVKKGKRYYFIIAPESLRLSLEDMASWKRQKGHDVIMNTVERIISTPGYTIGCADKNFDKEACVRNWLIATIDSLSQTGEKIDDMNLLIVGDSETSAPIRMFYSQHRDSIKKESFARKGLHGEYFMPSDVYFSDIVSNFKIDFLKDNIRFGCLPEHTYQPTINTGRILANKPDQISNFMNKLLIYEIDPGLGDSQYLNKGFVSRQYQHRTYSSIFDTFTSIKDLISLTDNVGDTVFANNRPTGEEVIVGMSQCGVASLQGHGSPASLACSGKTYSGQNGDRAWLYQQNYRYIQAHSSYGSEIVGHSLFTESNNSFDCLDNRFKPGIVYTLSCTVAPFDNTLNINGIPTKIPYNMASAYTVAGDYGGVAFLGNTRTGWDYENKIMEKKFGEFVENNSSIGFAHRKSGYYVSYKYSQFTRTLIGDPDIHIWKASPLKMITQITDNQSNIFIGRRKQLNANLAVYNGISKPCEFELNTFTGVSIPKSIAGIKENEDYAVCLYIDDYLPLIQVFASDCNLNNQHKKYFVRDLDLSDSRNLSNFAYNIHSSGELTINATQYIKTDKAFNVFGDGKVVLDAFGSVELKSDKIAKGGTMQVDCKEVLLDKGFSVERGGELTINIRK